MNELGVTRNKTNKKVRNGRREKKSLDGRARWCCLHCENVFQVEAHSQISLRVTDNGVKLFIFSLPLLREAEEEGKNKKGDSNRVGALS